MAALAAKIVTRPSTTAQLSVHPQTGSPLSSSCFVHSQNHSMIPSQLCFSRPGTSPGVKPAPHSCTPSSGNGNTNTYHHNEGFVPLEFRAADDRNILHILRPADCSHHVPAFCTFSLEKGKKSRTVKYPSLKRKEVICANNLLFTFSVKLTGIFFFFLHLLNFYLQK